MYKDITIIVATKHKKEEVIRKPFEDAFNAVVIVPNDYDTDQFGTFTGEIPRQQSAYDTVIQKAKQAAFQYGFDYAVANEGTFGAHPTFFLGPADIELMCFVDKINDLVVVESEVTTETNFAHCDITMVDDYTDFLKKIKFGEHGLIVRSLNDHSIIAKGVTQGETLDRIIKTAFEKSITRLRLETDMRAMMNPTRMRVIQRLALKLVQRLKKKCAGCGVPGFGKLATEGKLLCKFCRMETELYQFEVHRCVKCTYQECYPRADGWEYADQQYCPYCNP